MTEECADARRLQEQLEVGLSVRHLQDTIQFGVVIEAPPAWAAVLGGAELSLPAFTVEVNGTALTFTVTGVEMPHTTPAPPEPTAPPGSGPSPALLGGAIGGGVGGVI